MSDRDTLGARIREATGSCLLALVHAPPASLLWWPIALVVVALRRRTARGGDARPGIGWALASAGYWLVVVATAVVVHGWIPYLSRADLGFVGTMLAAGLVLDRVRPSTNARRGPVVALVVLAATHMLVFPPLAFDALDRAVAGGVFAVGIATFAVLVGPQAIRRFSWFALAVALANGGLWVRHWTFYNLPASGRVAEVEARLGVVLVPLAGLPVVSGVLESPSPAINWNRPWVFEETCDARHYLVGKPGDVLRVTRPDGHAAGRAAGSSRNYWMRCDRGTFVTGAFTQAGDYRVTEVDLDTLEVVRSAPYCVERAADTLRVDVDRRRMWWSDDTGAVHEMGVDAFDCRQRFQGTRPYLRDIALEPASGDLFVLDHGAVLHLDPTRGAVQRRVELPSLRATPGPLARRIGRIALDAPRGRLLVTDMVGGRLHTIDLDDWTLTRSVPLGSGIRHLAIDDTRSVVLIGNVVTGELLVLDLETLAVRSRVFLGRRIGSMSFSRDRERLTFVTALGGISLDLDPFLAGLP